MTVKEHSERVRFDHNLVDVYLPDNKFKRIFPLDPGHGGYATNGDELEEFYLKLEKMAQTVWKKQVGMIQKKETNTNVHDKEAAVKKRRKKRKGILTSMTSHIVDKNKEQNDDQEEPPEDGFEDLEGIEEEENGSGDRPETTEKRETGGDLRHIVSQNS